MNSLNFIQAVYDYKKELSQEENRYLVKGETPDFTFGEHTSVLSACMELHMSNTGTSDPIRAVEAAKLCGWLMMRLESWTYSSNKFDSIVRQLIEQTVEETLKNSFYNETCLQKRV